MGDEGFTRGLVVGRHWSPSQLQAQRHCCRVRIGEKTQNLRRIWTRIIVSTKVIRRGRREKGQEEVQLVMHVTSVGSLL
jgi:hypothetical protein